MPGIWKLKTFPTSDVEKAVETIKARDPELWTRFMRYQRLEEGFNDQQGYEALNRELRMILNMHFSGLSSVDLIQLTYQVRQRARLECGLSI
jgi:hypothetical protein